MIPLPFSLYSGDEVVANYNTATSGSGDTNYMSAKCPARSYINFNEHTGRTICCFRWSFFSHFIKREGIFLSTELLRLPGAGGACVSLLSFPY